VCLWVKLANIQSVMVPIVDRGSVHGPVSYTIQSRPSEGFFFNIWNNIPNGDCSLLSPTKPTANRWYFLAMTVQSQQFTIYVDGNMEGTRAVRSDFTTTKNESKARTIGRMMEQNTDYVNGIIDDISIYNRALSQAEIQTMYTQVPTGIEERTITVPTHCSLDQNYPNPFNPSTTIRFGVPVRSHVTLTILNILGQQMAQLVDDNKEAGYHEVRFEASGLSSGAYFYRIQAGDFVQTRRLLLLK
jgi:hypothetical protein